MTETHVFYIPHADDEVLSMGPAIVSSIASGYRVHLILLTDGTADLTRLRLNGEFPCQWHQTTHDPIAEKFKHKIDEETFAELRRKEFLAAAAILGVPPENIDIYKWKDGGLDQESVYYTAREAQRRFAARGSVHHHSMTYAVDNHPDHLASGHAIKQLHEEAIVTAATWYVKRSMRAYIRNQESFTPVTLTTPEEMALLRRACEEVYLAYKPAEGLYAIGGHSVPESFQKLLKDYKTMTHDIDLAETDFETPEPLGKSG